jgi:hypothetical protein
LGRAELAANLKVLGKLGVAAGRPKKLIAATTTRSVLERRKKGVDVGIHKGGFSVRGEALKGQVSWLLVDGGCASSMSSISVRIESPAYCGSGDARHRQRSGFDIYRCHPERLPRELCATRVNRCFWATGGPGTYQCRQAAHRIIELRDYSSREGRLRVDEPRGSRESMVSRSFFDPQVLVRHASAPTACAPFTTCGESCMVRITIRLGRLSLRI